MNHFYFTRHGQTIWNVENKICGITDSHLTEKGHQDAIQLGNFIKEQKIHIDVIKYSPLTRAKDTALHISEITAIKAEEEQRLIEQNFGRYEGTARDGKEFALEKQNFINSFSGNGRKGETMLKVAQRIYNLIDEIKNDDKIYLLVAHNGISRIIQSYFYDMTNQEFAAFGIKNCELKRYDFQ